MDEPSLQFDKDYFRNRRYAFKKELISRHVTEVISWASKFSGGDLLEGSGKTALDVGCAYGYSSSVLESFGYETYGLDVSAWGVLQAKSTSKQDCVVSDAQSGLPFIANSFDLVTCFDVLEHLCSPFEALRGILEVCRGSVVCTTPNKTVEKTVRKITRDLDKTHVSVKSPAEWEKGIAEKLDYKLLKVEAFYDISAKAANRLLFKSFKMPKLGLTVRIFVGK